MTTVRALWETAYPIILLIGRILLMAGAVLSLLIDEYDRATVLLLFLVLWQLSDIEEAGRLR